MTELIERGKALAEGVANRRPPGNRYAEAALADEINKVATAAPGTRNDTLNKAAFSLSRFIKSGDLDEHRVRDDLTAAARTAGLDEREIAATINSATGARSGSWESFLDRGRSKKDSSKLEPSSSKPEPEPGQSTRRLVVTRGSQVKAKKLIWWEIGLILQYAINLLAAREGKGKSTVAASWAARETRNGGVVVWVGTEESREAAIVTRLIAAGADMTRIIFIDVETDLGSGALVFPLDLTRIEQVFKEHGVTMMILDPAKAVVAPGFSGNDDIAVRQYLEPIAALADRCKVTVIGLAHFGKRTGTDSGQLMLGSVAWSQVARCVLSIAEDPDTGTRVLTNTKANYVGTDRSVEFRIVSTTIDTEDGPTEIGSVEWLGDTLVDARDLLAGNDDDDHGERTAAEHWLEDYLSVNGATPSKVIKADAAKEKISEATLKRAKKKIGVIDRSAGFPRISTWHLASQLTDSQITPTRELTEPTEPTGPDQGKQDEPTGPDPQLAQASASEPTGEPTGHPAPPTPLDARRQELHTRRTVRFKGLEVPRCLICSKPVVATQGDTHLSCLSKARDSA